MTEHECEFRRIFIEEKLAEIVNAINPRVLTLRYKKSEFEWVLAVYPDDVVQINVTGYSLPNIVINVISTLFDCRTNHKGSEGDKTL